MQKLSDVDHGVYCVYEIRNSVTGQVYVGSTFRFNMRWREHKRLLELGEHHSRHLQYSFNKHGGKAFSMAVVEFAEDPLDMIEREQLRIDMHGLPNLYNCSAVSSGGCESLPVNSVDPVTGNAKGYESAAHAASEVIGDAGKSSQIRKAVYYATKCRGVYWTYNAADTVDDFSRKRISRKQGKPPTVFGFNKEGRLICEFATVADAARSFGASPSAISRAICSEKGWSAGGVIWAKTPECPPIKSRRTKQVVQKQNGDVVALWDSLTEAAKAVPGATIKGISSSATGYTKSHRGYRWEYVKI